MDNNNENFAYQKIVYVIGIKMSQARHYNKLKTIREQMLYFELQSY